ncbi:MAG: hypothetical protein J6Y77_00110, partial [Paludibacteraceae bacterium]|nr:hypothetical protein [Paludibacteraceae bacterium]
MTLPTPPAIPHHWAKGLSFALAAVLATVLLIRLVMTFRYTPVFCDSGYYLTVGRLMSEGARLYSDIRFAYPPVYPLILSWLTPIAPHHYAFWTGLHLLLTAATAWMVYRIARLCAIRHSFALLAAWLYLMGALLAGAGQVFLETPSCLAGMGALLLLAKHPQKSW